MGPLFRSSVSHTIFSWPGTTKNFTKFTQKNIWYLFYYSPPGSFSLRARSISHLLSVRVEEVASTSSKSTTLALGHFSKTKKPFASFPLFCLAPLLSVLSRENDEKEAPTKPVVFHPLPREELEKIANSLGLPMPAIKTEEELISFQELCFKTALEACCQGDWDRVSSPLFKKLTNTQGQFLGLPRLKEQTERLAREFYNAAKKGEIQTLWKLASEIPIDISDDKGQTAAHYAAQGKQKEALWVLAYLGADLGVEDRQGKSPSSYVNKDEGAKEKEIQELIQLVVPKGKHLLKSPPDFSRSSPEYLVFKGGGVKGIAYIGALKQLEVLHRLEKVRHVAGTSAGAITASLLAVGYTPDELEQHLGENFEIFLDAPKSLEDIKEILLSSGKNQDLTGQYTFSDPIFLQEPEIITIYLRAAYEIAKKRGLCRGEELRTWIENLIKQKTEVEHCTFGLLGELAERYPEKFKKLSVYAIQLVKKGASSVYCFNCEEERWKDLVISDAVLASATIPLVFMPHTLHFSKKRKKQEKYNHFVDGGLFKNFPLDLFDNNAYHRPGEWGASTNPKVLGFYLNSFREGAFEKSGSLFHLGKSLYYAFRDAEDSLIQLQPYNNDRMIEIPTPGIEAVDFGLSNMQKNRLKEAGREAVIARFAADPKKLKTREDPAKDNFHVKEPARKFVGREEILKQMKSDLTTRSFDGAVLKIVGPAGIGKTELIAKFAEQNAEEFSFIWTFDCGNAETMYNQLRNLARHLGIKLDKTLLEDRQKLLKDMQEKIAIHLDSCSDQSKPWLLIFENVSNSLSFPLPSKGGGVAILSREDDKSAIQLKGFCSQKASQLFEKVAQEEPSSDLDKITTVLGNHPLLLHLTAHFIAATGSSVEEFQEKHLKELQYEDSPSEKRSEQQLVALWGLIQKKLEKNHAKTLHCLELCSFLDTDTIELSLLEHWEANRAACSQILSNMERFGLISYSRDKTTFSVNKSLRELIRSTLPAPKKKERIRSLFDVFSNLTSMNLTLTKTFTSNEQLALYVDSLVSLAPKEFFGMSIDLLLRTGNFYMQKSQHLTAQIYFSKAHEKVLASLGKPETNIEATCDLLEKQAPQLAAYYGRALHYLGKSYFHLEELAKAEAFFVKAVTVQQVIDKNKYQQVDPIDAIIVERQGRGWILLESDRVQDLIEAETLYSDLKKREKFGDDKIHQRYCDLQLAKVYDKLAKRGPVGDQLKYYEQAHECIERAIKNLILKKREELAEGSIFKEVEYYLVQSKLYIDNRSPKHDLERAKKILEQIVNSVSASKAQLAEAHFLLGRVFWEKFQKEQGEKQKAEYLEAGKTHAQKSGKYFQEVQQESEVTLVKVIKTLEQSDIQGLQHMFG